MKAAATMGITDARIVAAHNLDIGPVAERLGANLKKSGPNERVGPCPRCGGNDRFGVNTKDRVFVCRGSGCGPKGGDGGDVVLMVEHVLGCDFGAALDWLSGERSSNNKDRGVVSTPVADGGSTRALGSTPSASPSDDEQLERAALRGPPTKLYSYTDEHGAMLYQKVRWEWRDSSGKRCKTFRQRRPAKPSDDQSKVRNGWLWARDFDRVPYRLPDVIEAVRDSETVYICEGEKDVETLAAWGLYATCTDLGAGQWPAEINRYFVGANVVILQDNDPPQTYRDGRIRYHPEDHPLAGLAVVPGRDHTQVIGRNLEGVARAVRVLTFPELPPKGDVTDWAEQSPDHDMRALLARVQAEARAWERERPASAYGAITWSELDKPGDDIEWLIKDWITKGDCSMVGGESKSGKTFFSVHLAGCLAAGIDFWGKPITKKYLVIYQAGESSRGVKKRFKAWREYQGIPADADIPLVILSKRVDLFKADADTQPLIKEIKRWQSYYPQYELALVVFDTFAKAAVGADENSAKEVGIILDNVQTIREEVLCASQILHHLNQAGGKLRGSTAIFANSDQVFGIVCDPETKIRTVRVMKQKEDEDGMELKFKLHKVDLGLDHKGQPQSHAVAIRLGERSERENKRVTFTLFPAETTVFRALLDALASHGETGLPPETKVPPGVRAVKVKLWYDRYMAIAAHASEDPRQQATAARQALKRVSDKLLRFEVIKRENPYVWLSGKPVTGYPETFNTKTDGNVVPFNHKPVKEGDSIGDML